MPSTAAWTPERAKAWRKANRAKIRESDRRWRRENPEKLRQYARNDRAKHHAARKAQQLVRFHRNKHKRRYNRNDRLLAGWARATLRTSAIRSQRCRRLIPFESG